MSRDGGVDRIKEGKLVNRFAKIGGGAGRAGEGFRRVVTGDDDDREAGGKRLQKLEAREARHVEIEHDAIGSEGGREKVKAAGERDGIHTMRTQEPLKRLADALLVIDDGHPQCISAHAGGFRRIGRGAVLDLGPMVGNDLAGNAFLGPPPREGYNDHPSQGLGSRKAAV